MSGRHVISAAVASLLLLLVLGAYQIGKRRSAAAPEAVRQVIEQRLASFDGIEGRLSRLEKDIGSLDSSSASEEVPDGTEAADPTNDRLAALESALATLELRVNGVEEDPVRRGYSFVESESAELRREGVNLLSRVARFDAEARAAIRILLRDPNSRVREQAAQKLGDLKDKDSKADMVTLLEDPYALARRRAVQALGAMGASDATDEIGQSLVSDTDVQVRRTAADVLGKLNTPEAKVFLVAALKDGNDAVRGEAIASLGEIGATSAATQLRTMYDQDPGNHRRRLVLTLKRLGDEAPLQQEVGRLSELVTSDVDVRVRVQSIRDLAALARVTSRGIFSQALEDPSPEVRREAKRALR